MFTLRIILFKGNDRPGRTVRNSALPTDVFGASMTLPFCDSVPVGRLFVTTAMTLERGRWIETMLPSDETRALPALLLRFMTTPPRLGVELVKSVPWGSWPAIWGKCRIWMPPEDMMVVTDDTADGCGDMLDCSSIGTVARGKPVDRWSKARLAVAF